MFSVRFTALLVISAAIHMAVASRDVFAHFMIGNAAHMNAQDWARDVSLAKKAHIDGFALNIAKDDYTDAQLKLAYNAAAACPQGKFKVFISFDYAAAKAQGGFGPEEVKAKINAYKTHPGQYKRDGKPLFSTFEGADNKGDLPGIKQGTGAFMVPNYSSLGPEAAAAVPGIDGLFSWDAWPDGVSSQVPTSAPLYKSTLAAAKKAFMMPISPWFYTSLPSKDWLWRSDSLWHLSWMRAVQLQPEMIEIITWNDWGESSYIAPNPRVASAYPEGAESYVAPTSHAAWLADLPYYIQWYKIGTPPTKNYTPHITFWHRLSPAAACPSCKCNADYQSTRPAGNECAEDAIFVTAFPPPGQVAIGSVSIGGVTKRFSGDKPGEVVHKKFAFKEFGGKFGPVKVQGKGMGKGRGKAIQEKCVAGWNAFVGGTKTA